MTKRSISGLTLAILAMLGTAEPARAAGLDGISYLVAVTQMKANNANDEALAGADQPAPTPQTKKAKPKGGGSPQ